MPNRLVLCGDGATFKLKDESCHHFIYCFGFASIQGENYTVINDPVKLHQVGDALRQEFADWVFSFNKSFLSNGLALENLSLFFLTDLSAKRGEVFDTFDRICGLVMIKEVFRTKPLGGITLINLDLAMYMAVRSVFPEILISGFWETNKFQNMKRRVSDLMYLTRYAVISVRNIFSSRREKKRREISNGDAFHTFFPSMLSPLGLEEKYGEFATNEGQFVGSILSDGMHQSVSIFRYLGFRRSAHSQGVNLVDDFFSLPDLIPALSTLFKITRLGKSAELQGTEFHGINVRGFLRQEMLPSSSRIIRLCALRLAYRRFFSCNESIKRVFYYPAEYPYGRMIAYELKVSQRKIKSAGFQMGPVSPRRLEQILGADEVSTCSLTVERLAIPDQFYVEDAYSENVYLAAGYKGIVRMQRLFRCQYLESLKKCDSPALVVLALGLHDTPGILLSPQIRVAREQHPEFSVKIHPRSGWRRQFYTECKKRNIRVIEESISQILPLVKKLFATYSSVALEAQMLGISVEIIDIPGRINTLCIDERKKCDGARK
jgi:hypothetical protein